ncbi:MAG: hypothetical protein LKI25_06660 [Atopobiaceae bacterium]|jgi:hypothetical protein|nr:hypothetical protein [Atopobiaceae bacterium]MCI2173875.1 hypothetical protein [Atopobiaceae bacterium]MCI2208035.1 hypothetical protein [Atopobiaceae bacterium]
MDARGELVRRCALKRLASIGPLSKEGFSELLSAVAADPRSFADDAEEQAFLEIEQTLEKERAATAGDDLLDDDEYQRERRRRFGRIATSCDRALALDPTCIDARLLSCLVADQEPDATLGLLLELDHDVADQHGAIVTSEGEDAWDDVFLRPRLRVRAAISRTCLDTARYRMAASSCLSLIDASPTDALGARLTAALALARLEDETGFDELDARFLRQGNAWSHLARVLLLFKLDRPAAARRALRGFDSLCTGGAYALLRPTYVETYLPDRPQSKPGSFEEVTLCVHEADPIVVDTPDFIPWASEQPGFAESAGRFADRLGYDM